MKAKSTPRKDQQQSQSPARPAAQRARPTSSASAKQAQSTPLQCANCGTSTTPVWRRDSDRRRLCNACGLYFKSHKTSRGSEVARPGSQPNLTLSTSFDGVSAVTTTTSSSGPAAKKGSRTASLVPGAIQLPVIPRWPNPNAPSQSIDNGSVPSQHPPMPQRSQSFAGTTSSTPYFSGYKLAPLGTLSHHNSNSGSSTPTTTVSSSAAAVGYNNNNNGIVDDLPPLSLASSSLSLSGQHHFPAHGSSYNHFSGAGSWSGSGSSPSSSSSPSTPPFYGSDEHAHAHGQHGHGGMDFVGVSIGASVRPISTFFRQNSLPTLLPPLSSHNTGSGSGSHGGSGSGSSSPSPFAHVASAGDFSFSPMYTPTSTSSSSDAHSTNSSSNNNNTSNNGGQGQSQNWFLDPLDHLQPPTTASSSYSSSSATSSSSADAFGGFSSSIGPFDTFGSSGIVIGNNGMSTSIGGGGKDAVETQMMFAHSFAQY